MQSLLVGVCRRLIRPCGEDEFRLSGRPVPRYEHVTPPSIHFSQLSASFIIHFNWPYSISIRSRVEEAYLNVPSSFCIVCKRAVFLPPWPYQMLEQRIVQRTLSPPALRFELLVFETLRIRYVCLRLYRQVKLQYCRLKFCENGIDSSSLYLVPNKTLNKHEGLLD